MFSIEKNYLDPKKKIEIITVGKDGQCINKISRTANVDNHL